MNAPLAPLAIGSAVLMTLTAAPPAAIGGGGLPPTEVYAGGFLHLPLGGVVLEKTGPRKVKGCCLGSDGQDGIEVRVLSVSGGGMGVDPGPLAGSAELVIKHKGWDGTIKGSTRLYADVADDINMELDFSGVGADAIRAVIRDENGVVISDSTTLGSARLINLSTGGAICVSCGGCPNGGTPQWYTRWVPVIPPRLENGFWIYMEWVAWFGCPGSVYDNLRHINITPGFNAEPAPFDIESAIVGGANLPPIEVAEDVNYWRKGKASPILARELPLEVWGVGESHLAESCMNPGGCTPDTVDLLVSNLTTAGDGVAIGIGPSSGGGGGATVSKEKCCRGHVIIMKAFDDDDSELRLTRTPVDAMDPDLEEIDMDFSAIGATGFILELFGPGGVPLGEPTAHIGGGPRPIWGNRCPPGSKEVWTWYGTPANPYWVFQGCLGAIMEITLPGGTVVNGVESFRLSPLDATSSFGTYSRVEITADGGEILLKDTSVNSAYCPGDANGDGVVDFNDITAILANWLAIYTPGSGAGDANLDGVVDFNDITGVLANWLSTCP